MDALSEFETDQYTVVENKVTESAETDDRSVGSARVVVNLVSETVRIDPDDIAAF